MYFSSYSLIITQDKQIIARNTCRSYFETIKLNTWWFNYGSILDFKWRSPFCIIVWTIYDKGVNRAKVSKFQLQFEPSKSVFLCVFFFIFSKLRWFPETIFWSYKLYRFKISAQFRVRKFNSIGRKSQFHFFLAMVYTLVLLDLWKTASCQRQGYERIPYCCIYEIFLKTCW